MKGDNMTIEKTARKDGHTPGPWDVENVGVGRQADKIFVYPKKGASGDDGLGAVATIHEFRGNKWANARLIAAAPDLLYALEELKKQIWAHHKMNVKTDFDLMAADAAAGKAIAKATGKD
jgi:hypothetical protein